MINIKNAPWHQPSSLAMSDHFGIVPPNPNALIFCDFAARWLHFFHIDYNWSVVDVVEPPRIKNIQRLWLKAKNETTHRIIIHCTFLASIISSAELPSHDVLWNLEGWKGVGGTRVLEDLD